MRWNRCRSCSPTPAGPASPRVFSTVFPLVVLIAVLDLVRCWSAGGTRERPPGRERRACGGLSRRAAALCDRGGGRGRRPARDRRPRARRRRLGRGRSLASQLHGQAVWPAGLRRAPDFSLRDSDGQPLRARLAARPAGGGHLLGLPCHQECPLEGRALAAALPHGAARRATGRRRGQRQPVGRHPGARRAGRSGASASPASTGTGCWAPRPPGAGLAKAYRIDVRRTSGDIEHTDALYLIDSRGFERAGMVYPFLPTWVSNDLHTLAREGGV